MHELLKLVKNPVESFTTAAQTDSTQTVTNDDNIHVATQPPTGPSQTADADGDHASPHNLGAAGRCDYITAQGDTDVTPFYLLPAQSFAMFDMGKLEKHTNFSKVFKNRSTAYYGDYPYQYGSVFHEPTPIPEGNYIIKILNHLHMMMPHYIFNSILITKYNDGNDYISYHSDNEPEIAPDSSIVTISLGESRTVIFRPNAALGHEIEHSVNLHHGDAFVMSRSSQNHYKHCIPINRSTNPRISITCRYITPTNCPNPDSEEPITSTQDMITETLQQLRYAPDSPPCGEPVHMPDRCQPATEGYQPEGYQPPSEPPTNARSTTVYISSSLFKALDEKKLGSKLQDAKVFAYPGATAGDILVRLQGDKRFNEIDPRSVGQVFVLCANNNVDKILNVPRSHWTSIVHIEEAQYSNRQFSDATDEIANLGTFLTTWSRKATINFINLLPRYSRARNLVINDLNSFIEKLCESYRHFNIVHTEKTRRLFSNSEGHRKNEFFSSAGPDNIHLAPAGIARLANHLKYVAHNGC